MNRLKQRGVDCGVEAMVDAVGAIGPDVEEGLPDVFDGIGGPDIAVGCYFKAICFCEGEHFLEEIGWAVVFV